MNKPRLIDANELITTIAIYVNANDHVSDTPYEAYWNVIQWIKEQRTAYDTDRVVEQLEDLETYKQTVTMEKHPFCASEIETVSKKKAIEIIKGNCSENPNSSKGGGSNEQTA